MSDPREPKYIRELTTSWYNTLSTMENKSVQWAAATKKTNWEIINSQGSYSGHYGVPIPGMFKSKILYLILIMEFSKIQNSTRIKTSSKPLTYTKKLQSGVFYYLNDLHEDHLDIKELIKSRPTENFFHYLWEGSVALSSATRRSMSDKHFC